MSRSQFNRDLINRLTTKVSSYMAFNDAEDILDPILHELDNLIQQRSEVAISREETLKYANQLRRSAIHNIKIADKIDPEHAVITLISENKMAILKHHCEQIKRVISEKNAQIAKLTAALEAKTRNEAEYESRVQELTHANDGLKTTVVEKIARLESSNRDLNARIGNIVKIVGDVPDNDDASALRELEALLVTESQSSKVSIQKI